MAADFVEGHHTTAELPKQQNNMPRAPANLFEPEPQPLESEDDKLVLTPKPKVTLYHT